MYKIFNKDKYVFLGLGNYGYGKGINIATVEAVGKDDVKPFKIVSNDSKGSKHGKQTALTCLSVAPESKLYALNSKNFIDLKDYILENNIKIIFSSTTGALSNDTESENLKAIDYLKSQGVIFLNASGNSDNRPEGILVTSEKCINIGTVDLVNDKVSHSFFGRSNDYTHFASFGKIDLPAYPNPIPFDDYYVSFTGTSFSTPLVAGMIALIVEKGRKQGYELNQDQIYQILKDNSKMYGLTKEEVGNGVVQLPEQIDFSKYGGNEMEFKDVEQDKWYTKAIDYVSDKGLMKGYEDGTFKPNSTITRAEMAQILYNLKNK